MCPFVIRMYFFILKKTKLVELPQYLDFSGGKKRAKLKSPAKFSLGKVFAIFYDSSAKLRKPIDDAISPEHVLRTRS